VLVSIILDRAVVSIAVAVDCIVFDSVELSWAVVGVEVLNSVVSKIVLLSDVVPDSKGTGREVLKAVVLSNSVVDSTVLGRFVLLTCVVVSSAELVPTLVVDMIEASLDVKDVLKPEEGPRLKVEVSELLEDSGVLLSIVDEIKTVLPSVVEEAAAVVPSDGL